MGGAGESANAHPVSVRTRAVEPSAPLLHVRSVGGIDEYRLANNGLRVLLVPWRIAPVALLMLTYEVGSCHEPAGRKGVSHLLEHMMFKGSRAFDRRKRASIIDLLPAVGATINATTWLDRTQYFDLVPTSALGLAAAIEADRMHDLSLAAEDIEAERAIVLDEFDLRDSDATERFTQAVWSTSFADHPYGVPVIGVRDDIVGLSRDDLVEHYRGYYHPGNATLTVIGDVDRTCLEHVVCAPFARIPATDPPAAVSPVLRPQNGERRIDMERAGAIPSLLLAYRIPHGRSADTDAVELLSLVLAGGTQSRLHRALVEPGIAVGVSARASRLREQGLLEVQALLRSGSDFDRAERAIREAIAQIRDQGIDAQELQRAKMQARGSLLTSRDGPLAMAMQLNEAIAAGDWTGYATAADRLFAVSAADVRRVARLHLRDEALTVGRLVPRRAACDAANGEAAPT